MKSIFLGLALLFASIHIQAQQLTLVKDIQEGSSGAIGMFHKAHVFNNRLFFTANDGVHGEEYWSTDGTESGTLMLMDINEGAANTTPDYTQYARFPGMCEFDGYLYFTANANNLGEELWRTDGTATSTELCDDIYPDFYNASPTFFHTYKDMMYFTAVHPEYQREPFILRHDDNNEPQITSLGDLYEINGVLTTMWNTYSTENSGTVITFLDTLIFRWYGLGSGLETWITNGTPEYTGLLYDNYIITSLEMSSSPKNYTILQDTILCYSSSNDNGDQLWKITRDPSIQNGLVNTLITSIFPGGNADIKEFHLHEDRIFFSANDGVHGQELWVTDGTEGGTFMLKDIISGGTGSYPKNFTSYNGKIYFTTFDGFDEGHIWISDGTAEGTFSAADIWPAGMTRSYASMKWQEYNGKLYFPVFNSGLGEHYLAVTNGTNEGTYTVFPTNTGVSVQLFNGFNKFMVMNDELYFVASPVSDNLGPELYKLSEEIIGATPTITDETNLILYPNPLKDELTIISKGSSSNAQMAVYDISGKEIMLHQITQRTNRFDTTDWPTGVYFIEYRNGDEVQIRKVVKL